MDVQVLPVFVRQGIRFDLLDALLDPGKADQRFELPLSVADLQQPALVHPHNSVDIQLDHAVVQEQKLVLGLAAQKFVRIQSGIQRRIAAAERGEQHLGERAAVRRFAVREAVDALFFQHRGGQQRTDAVPQDLRHLSQFFGAVGEDIHDGRFFRRLCQPGGAVMQGLFPVLFGRADGYLRLVPIGVPVQVVLLDEPADLRPKCRKAVQDLVGGGQKIFVRRFGIGQPDLGQIRRGQRGIDRQRCHDGRQCRVQPVGRFPKAF